MSNLITYKNLQIVTPTPNQPGGLALNNNFTYIADLLQLLSSTTPTLDQVLTAGSVTQQSAEFGGLTVDDSIRVGGHLWLGEDDNGLVVDEHDAMTITAATIATPNNTLDDGSGNMNVAAILSIGAFGDTYLERGNLEVASINIDSNQSLNLAGSPVTTINNTLDDGSGNMTVNGILTCNVLQGLGAIYIGEDEVGLTCDDHSVISLASGNVLYVGPDGITTSGGTTLDDGNGNMILGGTSITLAQSYNSTIGDGAMAINFDSWDGQMYLLSAGNPIVTGNSNWIDNSAGDMGTGNKFWFTNNYTEPSGAYLTNDGAYGIITSGGNTLDDGNGNMTIGGSLSLPDGGGVTMVGAFSCDDQQIESNGSGTLSAGLFAGSGSGLTNLNATNLTTGTVNASRLPLITGTNGGTGVNNGTKTITLGGNLTTSGAFTTTLTATANTSVTLPTTGTLATTAQVATALPLAGGTMSGAIAMGNHAITGVSNIDFGTNSGAVITQNGGSPVLYLNTGINFILPISSGTWNASVIGSTYGGTGVNNGSKTITLGGNLTTSGAFTTTFTATANTSLTLPPSGTVATTAGVTSSIASAVANYLPLSGGELTGNLAIDSPSYGFLSINGPYVDATSDGMVVACSGESFSTDSGTIIDDGFGNMNVSNSVTAQAFYLNYEDVGELIGGFIPDSAGLPIVDFGLNAPQFGTTDTTYNGSIFRLDNRGEYPFFQILFQPQGDDNINDQLLPFCIQNTGSTGAMPAVFIGWPTNGGTNSGYGTGANLQVYGTAQASSFQGAYSNTLLAKTANYTLTTSDSVILVNSSSNITMTLPAAATAGQGREYTIKTINSAATVKTSGSGQKIDGTDYSSTGYSLSAIYKYITVVSNGSAWFVIGSN